MADNAGALSFGFEADFSGFTRAAEGAGRTLDQLGRAADGWADSTSNTLSRTLGAAAGLQSTQSARMTAAAQAMNDKAKSLGTPGHGLTTAQLLAGQTIPDLSGDKDDDSAKVMTHLSEQLALLQTTGAAHDAIIERMKIETEQAKLGTDATGAEKTAVADLVKQIDAATASQTKLRDATAAMNQAWGFGSNQVAQGLESIILDRNSVGQAASGVLRSFARQGLNAAFTGSGPLAALFGTLGTNGATGGLFGGLGRAFTGGGGASAGPTPSFAGLFADGGSIDAGQWGIVGERGAEVVAGPAAVLPMSRVAGGAGAARSTQVINFNVSTPDAPSFARSESQMAALVSRAVARGQRNL